MNFTCLQAMYKKLFSLEDFCTKQTTIVISKNPAPLNTINASPEVSGAKKQVVKAELP